MNSDSIQPPSSCVASLVGRIVRPDDGERSDGRSLCTFASQLSDGRPVRARLSRPLVDRAVLIESYVNRNALEIFTINLLECNNGLAATTASTLIWDRQGWLSRTRDARAATALEAPRRILLANAGEAIDEGILDPRTGEVRLPRATTGLSSRTACAGRSLWNP